MPPPVSVVIPSWNGAALLERSLPALLAELRDYSGSECTVVDDGSTDRSRELLRESFREVRLIEQRANRGFSSAINAGIRAARHERVLLLNNDVVVLPGFLRELQRVFEERPDTFAVASLQQQRLPDGRIAPDGLNAVHWGSGFFELANRTSELMQGHAVSQGYCTAGCSLYSREKLLALGGFCELFDPFYYEDVELSLQAARRGWHLAFAPQSVVEHPHGSTTKRKPWKLKLVPSRNYLFLHWLLLDSPSLWRQHCFGLMRASIRWVLQGRFIRLLGLITALTRFPRILAERRRRGNGAIISMGDLLDRKDHAP